VILLGREDLPSIDVVIIKGSIYWPSEIIMQGYHDSRKDWLLKPLQFQYQGLETLKKRVNGDKLFVVDIDILDNEFMVVIG